MYPREAQKAVQYLAGHYPVVAITGPRQSGKTTLVQGLFSDKLYVSLETPDQYQLAREDPRAFLAQSETGLVIDEIQRLPELFSYIQGIVDAHKRYGEFIVTGSQQFGPLSGITQSLAGRVGLLELLPFSFFEVRRDLKALDDALYKGFYPPLYDRKVAPRIWCEDYTKTYIERDVRNLINVKDLSLFQRFLRLLAARTGQLLNSSELGNEAGIDSRTLASWLTILEASYIIFPLRPHHRNFSKRVVKSPKYYFYDSGLLCYLLGITRDDLLLSPQRGQIFESMMISEFFKYTKNYRCGIDFYFWRDNKGVEIDLLWEVGESIFCVEMKSGATLQSNFFKNLKSYQKYAGEKHAKSWLVYGGEGTQHRSDARAIAWREIGSILQKHLTRAL